MKRRGTTDEDIDEILGIALLPSGPGGSPAKFQATASRGQLAEFLKSFGEESVALRISALSDDEMQRVFAIAAKNFLSQKNYPKALSNAAVEFVEGKPRELVRQKPRSAT
jgi:hypothetical protein